MAKKAKIDHDKFRATTQVVLEEQMVALKAKSDHRVAEVLLDM